MPRRGIDYDTIICTASVLADTEGLDDVTLAAVAEKLNIRVPSLYNHVKGLSGLRQGLALAGVQELSSRLGKAAMGRAGDEAIRAVFQAYLVFARTRPGLYEASLSAPDPDNHQVQEAAQEVLDTLLRVLREYRLADDEALHAVRGLRSIAHGFVSLEAKGGFGLDLDRDESFTKLQEYFIVGLRSQLSKDSF